MQGGVVTFTHNALIEDPIGVRRCLDQIDGHPFWTSYILPAVVGYLAKSIAEEDKSAAIEE